jgi:hypothetical protein
MDLYAWIGEDELGSGEVGLKQGRVPAGLIPLVSIHQHKLVPAYLLAQLQAQVDQHRKPMRLVRFTLVEELVTLQPSPVN